MAAAKNQRASPMIAVEKSEGVAARSGRCERQDKQQYEENRKQPNPRDSPSLDSDWTIGKHCRISREDKAEDAARRDGEHLAPGGREKQCCCG